MGTFFGILLFILVMGIALKVGVFAVKVIFTIIGAIVGIGIIISLLPLGIGIGIFLLIPAIIFGIISCIFKCIKFIL
ncbi:hypothetical protein JYG23_08610 [Sedimentibacter sp. zth1]|uniref:hypothetical protein n=1 Tax=Sedimentibacter sp. zth1 TaxID=2816908 RepID=UPI001A92C56A|nr:hypothetical protein [Sedimentibacter sp. zth1]QSX04768.1 hypothetical protein JYG23_08610 [Sedimentibacter sp. zth1]